MIQNLSFHIKHKRNFNNELEIVNKIANYCIKHKTEKITSKTFKHFNLSSNVKNQIIRKYKKVNIKKISNVNLMVTNQVITYKTKKGDIVEYPTIEYKDGIVNIKPLQVKFNWNCGTQFRKINHVEIDKYKFMLSVSFDIPDELIETTGVLGIDHNCGLGRHIINMANLNNGQVVNLCKDAPYIRQKYFKKRKKNNVKGSKESRIMKDYDHKISNKIVDYAKENKLTIVMEKLSGMRNKHKRKKGKGSRALNRLINSWSFYRLQQFVEYKAKKNQIPFIKVNPHYTSQQCSYCNVIGKREGKSFICKNKKCSSRNIMRNADVNACFNIGKRGIETIKLSNERRTA